MDLIWVMMSIALSRVMETQLDYSRRISVADEEDEQEGRRGAGRLPYGLIIIFIGLLSLSPSSPGTTTHLHPSPVDREYVYPPLKLACVVPPTSSARHNHQKLPAGSIEEFLRETRVVAARGAKILSWAEGAVRLDVDDGKHDK